MLKHTVIGPHADGSYFAAYQVPGVGMHAAAAACSTFDQAQAEADRLNRMQIAAERALMRDRAARGLSGVYPGLKGKN